MHKLNKPSLMDDDDDDMSGFGSTSKRFLKTNKEEPKPKDNFQLELESKLKQRTKSEENVDEIGRNSNRFMKRENESSKHVSPLRTPTPRSIATDSDVADDSGAESFRMASSKSKGIGDSVWQPGLKKSPRSSLFDERKNDNKQSSYNINSKGQASVSDRDQFNGDISRDYKSDSKKEDSMAELNQKWNKPYQVTDEKRKSRLFEDDDEDDDKRFGKSNTNFLKTGKPWDNKSLTFNYDETDSVTKSQPKLSKFVSEQNERDYFKDKSSSKPFKFNKQSEELEKDEFSMKSKSKLANFNLYPEENEKNSFDSKPSTSSRFAKRLDVTDSRVNEKQDFSTKPFHRNSHFNYDSNEDDDDSIHGKSSSTQFLKTKINPDTRGKDKENSFLKPKPKESEFLFNTHDKDDNYIDDKSRSSSLFQKTNEPKDNKNKNNLPVSKYSKIHIDHDDSEDDSDQDRSLRSDFPKSNSHSSFDNIYKDKENDRYYPKPQKRESKSMPRNDDELPMFRTSTSPKQEMNSSLKSDKKLKDSDDIFSNGRPRSNGHEIDSDFKRRSIRFEDEAKDESGRSTRDYFPMKSSHSKTDKRQSRSPSPVSSVCDEFERDPVKQKLEEIKQRRQDRKRQEEVAKMNSEHRIVMNAINTVEDNQSQHDSLTSSKKKVPVSLSKKYQNIQPKIATKPNMRSVSMDHLNDLLTKPYEPNTDRNYSASQAIREATYNEWYKGKLKKMKEQKKEVVVEEKDPKEKRNDDDIKATYDAWLAKKKEYFVNLKKRKEDEQRKQVENKENKDSKDSTFELWKKLKDESKKKEIEKQKSETKKNETQKMKENEEKKEELRKKKLEWEKRQADDLKKKKRKEEEEKRKEEEIKSKANEKQMLAEISYKTWEEKMDENQQKLATFSKRSESLVQNRRAWRPSSNTVSNGK